MARSAPITGITDSELYTDVRSAMERLAACRQSFADAAGKLAQLLTPEHIQEVTRQRACSESSGLWENETEEG